jgi:glutamate--cysteine ligase
MGRCSWLDDGTRNDRSLALAKAAIQHERQPLMLPPENSFQRDDAIPGSDGPENTVVESKAQLVEYLESGCKPPGSFRLGAEQERFVLQTSDYSPAGYDGPKPGIKALLSRLQDFGWNPVYENGQPVALYRDGGSITIEPGGQIELSGAPWPHVHQIYEETRVYNAELGKSGESLGLSFLSLGHQPKHSPEELPWMPKQRYRIMRDWMPRRGALGLRMMQATCSIQVNLDFSCESEMVKQFRVALALQPVVAALFANSPFDRGQFSGCLSFRSKIWSDTDPDRCGSLPFVFEEDMSFERYTDYVLDVPMYFVVRDGQCIDAGGLSFRDFLAGKMSLLPGQQPRLSDWMNHLSTVFPQVRLKKYLEIRGADAGDAISRVPALAALWAGILYDSQSLDAAWERIGSWSRAERDALETGVTRQGFNTPFRGGKVQDIALWMLDLSREGLTRRNYRNQQNQDEGCYLEPLQHVAQTGQTFAEELLRRFESEWHGDIDLALQAMCEESLS